MLKLSLLKGFLFALFLCLWAANAPAQEQMIPPPVPDFYPSPPPDPDTLPPPPPMDWEALTPQDSQEGSDEPPSLSVPAPQAEASIPPAPPPVIEPLIPGLPDPAGNLASRFGNPTGAGAAHQSTRASPRYRKHASHAASTVRSRECWEKPICQAGIRHQHRGGRRSPDHFANGRVHPTGPALRWGFAESHHFLLRGR